MLKYEGNNKKKFPYLSTAPNLIDYFLIIGYETVLSKGELSVEQTSCSTEKSMTKSSIDITETIDNIKTVEPCVLSNIASDYCNSMLDEDIILQLVFPSQPQIIFKEDNAQIPSAYNVIFFINGDSVDAKTKIIFHGYARVFYEKRRTKQNETIYLPKALCIISQFPFFTVYKNITNWMITHFGNNLITIPIEVILYNLLNFVPSPLYNTITINLSQKPKQDLNNFSNDIVINRLSGYPHLDFNLCEVFKILPPHKFMQIYIIYMLEIDILFFSKNIENLNMIMYIFSVLMYPLTDSSHQWHIVSVSREELVEGGINSNFVGKQNSSVLGINCSYSSDINATELYQSYFVVDLDDDDLFYKYRKDMGDSKEVKEMKMLYKYIAKDIDNIDPQCVLLQNFKALVQKLNAIVVQNSNNAKKEVNFFENDERIAKTNKSIQELFYKFIIVLLNEYYVNYSMRSLQKNGEKEYSIDYHPIYSKAKEQEKIFFETFENTSKAKMFLSNYMISRSSIELYDLPYLFLENFLYIRRLGIDKDCSFNYLQMIDDFYFKDKNESIIIDFTPFYQYYQSNLQKQFRQDLAASQNVKRITQANRKEYQYNYLDINRDTLIRYIHFLSDITEEEMNNLFPSYSITENNTIALIDTTLLTNVIEKSLINYMVFSNTDLIIFSIMFIIPIISEHCSSQLLMTFLMQIINKLKHCMRNYISIILSMYYTFANKKIKEVSNDKAENELICFYLLYNIIGQKKILPDDKLLCYLNSFSKLEREAANKVTNGKTNKKEQKAKIIIHELIVFNHEANKKVSTKDIEKVIITSNNVLFDGNIGQCNKNNPKQTSFSMTFKDLSAKKEIQTAIYSPLKLYNETITVFDRYSVNLQLDKHNTKKLVKAVANIKLYIDYLSEFKDVSSDLLLSYLSNNLV